jgi:hypothetical protein
LAPKPMEVERPRAENEACHAAEMKVAQGTPRPHKSSPSRKRAALQKEGCPGNARGAEVKAAEDARRDPAPQK